ncbi:CHAT domain-containing protein [Streptomyces sp. NPDC002520]
MRRTAVAYALSVACQNPWVREQASALVNGCYADDRPQMRVAAARVHGLSAVPGRPVEKLTRLFAVDSVTVAVAPTGLRTPRDITPAGRRHRPRRPALGPDPALLHPRLDPPGPDRRADPDGGHGARAARPGRSVRMTVSLILNERVIARSRVGELPNLPPSVAIVYPVEGGPFEVETVRTFGQRWFGKNRACYVVDLSDHRRRAAVTKTPLTCKDGEHRFQAAIDIGFRVHDPALVVARNVRDALTVVYGYLTDRIRLQAARFAITEAMAAQLAVNQELGREIRLPEGITIYYCKVQMEPDDAAARHIQEREEARRRARLGVHTHDAKLGEVPSDEAIEDYRAASRRRREEQGRAALGGGRLDFERLIGEHLARHPEDTAQALEQLARIREAEATQHEIRDQRHAEMVKYLIERGIVREVDLPGLRQGVLGPSEPGTEVAGVLDFRGGSFHGPVVGQHVDHPEKRRLRAELAEQASPGREVPLQVQVTCSGGQEGMALRAFELPAEGDRLLITVHAPGLLALGDLQQELWVEAGRDSDVLRFGLRTARPGLHAVMVRAFKGGSFLGELRLQISVQADVPARDGSPRTATLDSLAFDPGEVTLQVVKAADGYSFQLLSETSYAPAFQLKAGDPRQATENIYRELRRIAAAAGVGTDARQVRRRLQNLGVALWRAAVPDAVRGQFWRETDKIRTFTVLGEHDVVPWELLYPLDGTQQGDGFLAEWLPVVRRVHGQERVRQLLLPQATFVVPPGSPPEAELEVNALRARFLPAMDDGGILTRGAEIQSRLDEGMAGLLHFACHNAFRETGSQVTMADGLFDPLDLATAQGSRSLDATRPLVFFNACRSAGQIDWYSTSLGWAPQFLEAGAGAFIGTLWPVRSDSALAYADAFYAHLITGRLPLGEASMKARQTIRDLDGDPTWLAYAVYGSPAATATTRGAP